MHLLLSWLILSVAMWVTAQVVPGFKLHGFWNAVAVAALFGVLNYFVGTLLYVGLVVGTLGLAWLLGFITHWIVNTIMLELAAALSSRVRIARFGSALLASALISVVSVVVRRLM